MSIIFTLTPVKTDSGYDPLVFRDFVESAFPHGENRGTFTKLIDSGTYVEKRGASDGDRSFSIIGDITKEEYEALDYFWREWTELRISFFQGMFVGYVTSMDATGGDLNMTFRPEGSMTEFYERWKTAQIAAES